MSLLFQQQYVFLQGSRPNLSVTRAEVGSVPVAGCHLASASKKTGRWSAGHSTSSFLTQVWKFRMVRVAFRANANATCFHFWHSDWLGGAGCFVIRGQRCHCSSFFSFCWCLGEGSIYSPGGFLIILMHLFGQVILIQSSQVTLSPCSSNLLSFTYHVLTRSCCSSWVLEDYAWMQGAGFLQFVKEEQLFFPDDGSQWLKRRKFSLALAKLLHIE